MRYLLMVHISLLMSSTAPLSFIVISCNIQPFTFSCLYVCLCVILLAQHLLVHSLLFIQILAFVICSCLSIIPTVTISIVAILLICSVCCLCTLLSCMIQLTLISNLIQFQFGILLILVVVLMHHFSISNFTYLLLLFCLACPSLTSISTTTLSL